RLSVIHRFGRIDFLLVNGAYTWIAIVLVAFYRVIGSFCILQIGFNIIPGQFCAVITIRKIVAKIGLREKRTGIVLRGRCEGPANKREAQINIAGGAFKIIYINGTAGATAYLRRMARFKRGHFSVSLYTTHFGGMIA